MRIHKAWENEVGYKLYVVKEENQKSYSLYIRKPNSIVREKIGLIYDLESFANVFKVDID